MASSPLCQRMTVFLWADGGGGVGGLNRDSSVFERTSLTAPITVSDGPLWTGYGCGDAAWSACVNCSCVCVISPCYWCSTEIPAQGSMVIMTMEWYLLYFILGYWSCHCLIPFEYYCSIFITLILESSKYSLSRLTELNLPKKWINSINTAKTQTAL